MLDRKSMQDWQEKLLNPGKISQAHFLLNGKRITCRDCHRIGKKITNADCESCHSLEWFSTVGHFYAQSHQAVADRSCLECHFEHKGYDIKITIPFREKEHKALPKLLREACVRCHIEQSLAVHPNNININCLECHSYNSWLNPHFNHATAKPKFVLPSAPYEYCTKCHPVGFHYTGMLPPDPITQCKPCHRKHRAWALPPGY